MMDYQMGKMYPIYKLVVKLWCFSIATHAVIDIRGSALSSAEKSHYQSKVFICVSNNRTYAVDRLLIGTKHGQEGSVVSGPRTSVTECPKAFSFPTKNE